MRFGGECPAAGEPGAEEQPNWDFGFYSTIGAADSDWPGTLQAMFGRRFSNDNRWGLGLRIWGIDFPRKNA